MLGNYRKVAIINRLDINLNKESGAYRSTTIPLNLKFNPTIVIVKVKYDYGSRIYMDNATCSKWHYSSDTRADINDGNLFGYITNISSQSFDFYLKIWDWDVSGYIAITDVIAIG